MGIVRRSLPMTRFIYLSIKPSPSRISSWPVADKANHIVQQWAGADPRIIFVDVANSLLGGDGKPNDSLFNPDKLHMNPAGYALWAGILSPVLTTAWDKAKHDL